MEFSVEIDSPVQVEPTAIDWGTILEGVEVEPRQIRVDNPASQPMELVNLTSNWPGLQIENQSLFPFEIGPNSSGQFAVSVKSGQPLPSLPTAERGVQLTVTLAGDISRPIPVTIQLLANHPPVLKTEVENRFTIVSSQQGLDFSHYFSDPDLDDTKPIQQRDGLTYRIKTVSHQQQLHELDQRTV